MFNPTSGVSIIIPTFNRLDSLRRLLESFRSLEHPDSVHVEVLIVDNGSTDGTAAFIAEQVQNLDTFTLKVFRESHKGKASALNLGLSHADGAILCVVDDDVVVHPEWLAGHIDCYLKTSFDAVQGRVLPGVDPGGKPADPGRLREYNIPIVDYGDDFREIRGLTGSNMSFKREVFERVGLFDVRLGPGAAGFSEDTEYSVRVRQAGFKMGYTPHAIVYHELNPRRYGRHYNRMVQYRKGLSRSIYRDESIGFKTLPNLLLNCVRFGFYKALGKSQKAYRTEGRIMSYWGYLVGRVGRNKISTL